MALTPLTSSYLNRKLQIPIKIRDHAHQIKTRLALAVNDLLKERKLKQRAIAILFGVPQPKVSALKNYRLDQFSVERLMEFLTALNQDVEIIIRPRNLAGAGQISVLAVQ